MLKNNSDLAMNAHKLTPKKVNIKFLLTVMIIPFLFLIAVDDNDIE